METAQIVDEVKAPAEPVPEYGPHAPAKHCGCGSRLTDVEHDVVELHRLWRAGEICESTYRRTLQQLESKLAILSRPF
jgi:hypothetical protein